MSVASPEYNFDCVALRFRQLSDLTQSRATELQQGCVRQLFFRFISDGTQHGFDIDPFPKRCLLEGLDELAYTLTLRDRIAAFEQEYAG